MPLLPEDLIKESRSGTHMYVDFPYTTYWDCLIARVIIGDYHTPTTATVIHTKKGNGKEVRRYAGTSNNKDL
jgi:hypothetical protein